MIINAEDRILGRLASEVARKAREADEVKVVNSEEAVISGEEKKVKEEYRNRYERGSRHDGPYFPKSPERILKRTVEGMLPDTEKGRDASGNVKFYIGVPEGMEDYQEVEVKKGDDLMNRNYVKLGEVSRYIGWPGVEK